MANYNYTHGGTTNRDRLRFLLGDHRGTSGSFTGTNQVFADEELDDLLLSTMTNGDIMNSARIAMQCRINREAMVAGVSGTTDTTDRPAAIVNAMRQLADLPYPRNDEFPGQLYRTNEDIDDDSLTDMGPPACRDSPIIGGWGAPSSSSSAVSSVPS